MGQEPHSQKSKKDRILKKVSKNSASKFGRGMKMLLSKILTSDQLVKLRLEDIDIIRWDGKAAHSARQKLRRKNSKFDECGYTGNNGR
jgi:hypothetical protein